MEEHVRADHGLEPKTEFQLEECKLCGITLRDPSGEHFARCHGTSFDDTRQYSCHFCEKVYSSRKACFTHLRMKHGLKLSNEQNVRSASRERKECHICGRDFSQKQILNKHLWKAHGYEVEKRKAFICPLCEERVSYGSNFSAHLLQAHGIREKVEKLEFENVDDFFLYKSAIQEETKYRFRKTTASKQTIEGLRSHYMCSQSGVYVYQGKGKRVAPERQIYKSGRACPAHMVVTEGAGRVHVTFHTTHVGHGACPYYEPKELKKVKREAVEFGRAMFPAESGVVNPGHTRSDSGWVCDHCGMVFGEEHQFLTHVRSHSFKLFPCEYCQMIFQNIDAWAIHLRAAHNVVTVY